MADPVGREVDRVSVRVLPNTKHFLPGLQKYLKRIQTQVRVEIPTSLDTTGLQAEASRAARAVEKATKVDLPVDVDASGAEAVLDSVARDRTANIGVDVDRSALRAATSALDAAVSAIGPVSKVGGIGLLSGGGVIGLAALATGAAQAAASVGAVAAAMLSAGGAAGVLGLAVGGQVVQMVEQQKQIKTVTEALAKLEPGTKEYRDKLAELNGLQRTFNDQFGPAADALDALKGAWAGFLKVTGTNTIALMASSLSAVSGVLPKLAPAANAAAVEVKSLVDQFARWTEGSGFAEFLDWIRVNGVRNLGLLVKSLGTVALAFGPVIAAFTPFANQMMSGLLGLSREFRNYTQAALESGDLQKFAAGSIDAFKQLAGFVGDLAGSLAAIGRASAAAGGGLLGGVGVVFDRLNQFLNSAGGQKALRGFFTGIGEGFAALGRAMGPVGEALKEVLPALGSILGSFGTAIGAALSAVAGPLAILAGPLARVADVLATGIARALEAMGPGLETLASGLGTALVDMVTALAPMLPHLARSFGTLALAIATSLVPALPALVRAFTQLLPVIPPLLRTMANMLPVVVPLLKGLFDIVATVGPYVAGFARALVPVGKAIGDLRGPLAGLITGIGHFLTKGVGVPQALGPTMTFLRDSLLWVLKAIGASLRFIGNLFRGAAGDWSPFIDQLKGIWKWLDDINNKLHDWMVKLDAMPGIEIPGIGDDEHRKPPMGPPDTTAPHGPSPPVVNNFITAHDYNDFDRKTQRHRRHANAGGVVFVP